MFKLILAGVLFAIKGAIPTGYVLSPAYIATCERKIVMLSLPMGSEKGVIYIYEIDSNKLDSAFISIGRAPEEVSFFGLNSMVCNDSLIFIYDKFGKKINYYDYNGKYKGQFLLSKTPYYMTGAGKYLILLGMEYIIHVDIDKKKITVNPISFKEFSPYDMWLGTVFGDTAWFFEGTKMIFLKFDLKNGKFLGHYNAKDREEWGAKIVERKMESGAVGALPLAGFSRILRYKDYFILKRSDHEKRKKNVLLILNGKNFSVEKAVHFPSSVWLLSYDDKNDLFFLVDDNERLVKISPLNLGIK